MTFNDSEPYNLERPLVWQYGKKGVFKIINSWRKNKTEWHKITKKKKKKHNEHFKTNQAVAFGFM